MRQTREKNMHGVASARFDWRGEITVLHGLLRRDLVALLRSAAVWWFLGSAVLFWVGYVGVELLTAPLENFEIRYISAWSDVYISAAIRALSVMLILFVPPIAGISILQEFERETAELLVTSYVRPVHLLLAKVFAVWSVTNLLLFAFVPLVSINYFAMGQDIESVSIAFLCLSLGALLLAIMGVSFSAALQRLIPAAIISSGFALFYPGLPFILLGGLRVGSAPVIQSLSPFLMAIAQVSTSTPKAPAPSSIFVTAEIIAGHFILLFVVARALTSRRFRNVGQAPPKNVFTRDLEFLKENSAFAERKRRSIPDWLNPVYALEAWYQSRLFWRNGLRIVLFSLLAALISVLPLDPFGTIIDDQMIGQWVYNCILFFPFIVPAFAAGLYSRDYEFNLTEGLAATPLRPAQIAVGKALIMLPISGLLIGPLLVPASVLLIYAYGSPFLMLQSNGFASMVVGFTTGIVLMLAVTAACLIISLAVRSTALALFMGYVSVVVICVGVYFAAQIYGGILTWIDPVASPSRHWYDPDPLLPFSAVYTLKSCLAVDRSAAYGFNIPPAVLHQWYLSMIWLVGISAVLIALSFLLVRSRYTRRDNWS
jgi:ABC-type transport system involved in multi-copper enzyme maturation permease subunit